jgi:hypothetical protein
MNLMSKFEPTTKAKLIQLNSEFIASKMVSILQYLIQWIQDLEMMMRKLQILGNWLTDMDLTIHTLHNLPDEYETTNNVWKMMYPL